VPEGIPNADIDCKGHSPGDYCTYLCFNDYQMLPSDNPYQDCLPEGYWTMSPCCVEKGTIGNRASFGLTYEEILNGIFRTENITIYN